MWEVEMQKERFHQLITRDKKSVVNECSIMFYCERVGAWWKAEKVKERKFDGDFNGIDRQEDRL